MTARQPGEKRSGAERVSALLCAFDERHRVLSLTALARRAALPVSTAHRLVGDLTANGLLVRRRDQTYEIGAGIWHLGRLSPQTALAEAALPHMQDLVTATGQTAHLAVLDGARALVLERLAGTRSFPTPETPGRHIPLHCTAVGKALLAHAPEDVVGQVVDELAPRTAHTITEPRVLTRQLEQVRRTGLARTSEEHQVGVVSVAVPLTDHSGLIGALGLVAPINSPSLRHGVRTLRDAAAAVVGSRRRNRTSR